MKHLVALVMLAGACSEVDVWSDYNESVLRSESFQTTRQTFIAAMETNDRAKLSSVLADRVYDYDGAEDPYTRDEVLDMLAEVHAKCLAGTRAKFLHGGWGAVGMERAAKRRSEHGAKSQVPAIFGDKDYWMWLQPDAPTHAALAACGEKALFFDVIFTPRGENEWKVRGINIPRASTI